MSQDSKIINYSLYFLLLGFIFLISYYFIRPLIFETKKVQAEFAAYQGLLKEKEETLEEFNRVAVSYKEKKSEIDKINEMVLPEPNMIYTLVQFETIASRSGMVMKNISFGSIQDSADSSFSVFPVNLSVEGTYENFKNFLDTVARNIFLMDVSQISFSETETPGMYIFSLEVDTYTFKTSQEKTSETEQPEEAGQEEIK